MDETTFHVSVRVNMHNCLIWGTENEHISYELKRVSPKENLWCGVTSEKVYGRFFFEEETVCAVMIEKQDGILDTIIYQLDGAPPHSEGTIKPHIQRSLVRP